MSLEYTRRFYGVPAYRGRWLEFQGVRMRITGADSCGRLRVRPVGIKRVYILHPLNDVVYLGKEEVK